MDPIFRRYVVTQAVRSTTNSPKSSTYQSPWGEHPVRACGPTTALDLMTALARRSGEPGEIMGGVLDWVSPLFAIAGVIIGAGSSLVVERWRWRRERQREAGQVQREVYIAYLTHMARAYEGMRLAAQDDYDSAQERRRALLAAFAESNVYETRFRLTMLAPAPVVELAVHAFRKCRSVRDLLADGRGLREESSRAAQLEYSRALQATSDAMRKELGIPELPFRPYGFAPGEQPPDPITGR